MYTAHDILKLLQSDKMKFCHWKAGRSYTWKSEEAITAYVPYWRKTKEAYAFSQLYQNHSRSPDPVAKKVSIWYPTHQFQSLFFVQLTDDYEGTHQYRKCIWFCLYKQINILERHDATSFGIVVSFLWRTFFLYGLRDPKHHTAKPNDAAANH